VLTIAETIPTLWQTVRDFAKKHPSYIAKDNSAHFMVDEPDKGLDGSYNMCHVFSPTFHSYNKVLVKL
jgi:alpha 1,2-mannosyltransferase